MQEDRGHVNHMTPSKGIYHLCPEKNGDAGGDAEGEVSEFLQYLLRCGASPSWLSVGSTQPPTTSIYNYYIFNLPLHARVGGCTVG